MLRILDTETGEFEEREGSLENCIIRDAMAVQKQNNGYKSLLKGRECPFFWGNMVNIKELLDHNKIKLTTLGAILVLGCYINGESNLICKADRTPYTTKEIMEDILKMPIATFKRFLSDCKKAGILSVEGRGKEATYRLNDKFHYIGKVDKSERAEMVRIYKEGIMSMYRNGLALDDIGFLYLILPYVDYDTCTIVDNPFAEEPKPLTYKDLGDLLEFSRGSISKYLNMKFEHDFGKGRRCNKRLVHVFGKFTGGTEGRFVFCVNPIILRRCTKSKGSVSYDQLESIFKAVSENI